MPTTTTATTYKNYIDGEWVASRSGHTFENRNPANTDDLIGVFQQSTADDVRAAIAAASRAYERWRLVPAPKRGRDSLQGRAAVRRAQGAVRPGHDTRDGEGPERNARRRPGSDRHDLLHGWRGPAHVRPDRALGAARTSSRCRCASRWASARSSRRGISRWRFRRGRSFRRWSAATPSSSSRRRRRRCRR